MSKTTNGFHAVQGFGGGCGCEKHNARPDLNQKLMKYVMPLLSWPLQFTAARHISGFHSSWSWALGVFMHISKTTPVVSALKNPIYSYSFLVLEVSAEILNHCWIQAAISFL
jgi:hypothetical protein